MLQWQNISPILTCNLLSIQDKLLSLSHLLLLSGFQHLFGPAQQLILVADALLQLGHSQLQLANQTLLLMELRVQSAVFPAQRRHLLLGVLEFLKTLWKQAAERGLN